MTSFLTSECVKKRIHSLKVPSKKLKPNGFNRRVWQTEMVYVVGTWSLKDIRTKQKDVLIEIRLFKVDKVGFSESTKKEERGKKLEKHTP